MLTPVQDLLSQQTAEPLHAIAQSFVFILYARKAQEPRSRINVLVLDKQPFKSPAPNMRQNETG